MTGKHDAIEALSSEERVFPPGDEFVAQANATSEIYEQKDWVSFWQSQALERVSWFTEPAETLDDTEAPFFRWFADGVLNLSYNCLDRHLEHGGDKVAFHWEGEPGDTRTITYRDLAAEVGRFANALADLGVERGERVAIYLGMIPELPVAMLACARLGAIHSVVFGGFSSDALAQRITDAEAKVLVTADGAYRRGGVFPLKENADAAAAACPSIEKIVVVRRCENDVAMEDGRDLWYHDVVADASTERAPEPMNAEDPLFILYTSGTTAKAAT
jgi:acetyl-CoA synthetase